MGLTQNGEVVDPNEWPVGGTPMGLDPSADLKKMVSRSCQTDPVEILEPAMEAKKKEKLWIESGGKKKTSWIKKGKTGRFGGNDGDEKFYTATGPILPSTEELMREDDML